MADNIVIAGCVQASNQNVAAVIRATESGGVYTLVVSGGGGGGAVDSVNGQTGTVVVDLASTLSNSTPPIVPESVTISFDAVTPGATSTATFTNGVLTAHTVVS
jgi:hypothetical protein